MYVQRKKGGKATYAFPDDPLLRHPGGVVTSELDRTLPVTEFNRVVEAVRTVLGRDDWMATGMIAVRGEGDEIECYADPDQYQTLADAARTMAYFLAHGFRGPDFRIVG